MKTKLTIIFILYYTTVQYNAENTLLCKIVEGANFMNYSSDIQPDQNSFGLYLFVWSREYEYDMNISIEKKAYNRKLNRLQRRYIYLSLNQNLVPVVFDDDPYLCI